MLDHVDDAEPETDEEEEEVYVAPVVPEKPVFEQRTTNKVANDEVSVIMESMIINGNIATEGALDIRGSIVGDVEALGKLNITGTIQVIPVQPKCLQRERRLPVKSAVTEPSR